MNQRFDLVWPQWQPPPESGLVARVTDVEASFRWATAQLAKDADGVYVWAPAGDAPERRALALLERPGVVAVTIAPARADARWVALGLEVATCLTRRRAEPGSGRAHLTSVAPPVAPTGTVRIPHLLTVRRGQVVTDAVVWEVAPAAIVRHFGETPDLRLIEHHLPELLRLRAAARAGRLPATAAASRLANLLHGRELSIELVYERFDLFRVLLGRAREHRPL